MKRFLKLAFSFLLGATCAAFIFISISYLVFSSLYRDKIYPNVRVDGQNLSGLTRPEAEKILTPNSYPEINLTFNHPNATVSASSKSLSLVLDTKLMATRAYSIGRQTKNPYHNFLQIIAAWQDTIDLPLEATLDNKALNKLLDPVAPQIEKSPVDAVFKFEPFTGPDRKGRVVAYTKSEDGREIDRNNLEDQIKNRFKSRSSNFVFSIPTKIVPPAVKSSTANDMGIKGLLGRGQSYFYDSIPNRIYNIKLGTEKVAGSLIPPGEVFSFDQAIGTVSAIFGFAKAYAIKEGKTVLDDGGGVCQVSTTLYRAALNSGLPIIERLAHSYRVGFYEQGGFLPGMDATVYPPSPDFKFKNDTNSWILIQGSFDPDQARLTFELFGTNDGRLTQIQGPYILSTSPPPEPIYEDDPNLPKDQTKQVDTAHWGAKTYFQRTVTRGQETLINETVYSNYIPWPARFLRGTKT